MFTTVSLFPLSVNPNDIALAHTLFSCFSNSFMRSSTKLSILSLSSDVITLLTL
jgi:hypothetical protein